MAALTDKQKTIYNFLKSKPGYLKKSASNIPVSGTIKDKQTALDKAKAFFKKKLKPLTIAELNVVTKANNKAFEKASPAQKRVIIAQDVIAQLAANKIKAQKGVYIESDEIQDKIDESGEEHELQTLIKESKEPCQVCGIGSLFVCEIIRNDNFRVDDSTNLTYLDNEDIESKLAGIFEIDQLNLIETAFEGRVVNDDRNVLEYNYELTELGERAVKFGSKWYTDKGRLIAIMKNIIKNKGTFKP